MSSEGISQGIGTISVNTRAVYFTSDVLKIVEIFTKSKKNHFVFGFALHVTQKI